MRIERWGLLLENGVLHATGAMVRREDARRIKAGWNRARRLAIAHNELVVPRLALGIVGFRKPGLNDLMDDSMRAFHRVRARSAFSVQWTTRVRIMFERLGMQTLGDIMDAGLETFRRQENIGAVSVREIRDGLARLGLHAPERPKR